jgi:hypothetical protein
MSANDSTSRTAQPSHDEHHRERRILLLVRMINDAHAVGMALRDHDGTEACFRAQVIQHTARQEGLLDIEQEAAGLAFQIQRAAAGSPAIVGMAYDRLSRSLESLLAEG